MSNLLDTTTGAMLLLLFTVLALVVVRLLSRLKERRPRMREIPPLGELQAQLGEAAESGKPIHIALGSGGLGSGETITSLAGLQLVQGLADSAVRYDVPPIITVGDPTLAPLAQDVLRRAYERAEIAELYDSSRVRFVAPSSLAYGAGAIAVGAPEDVHGDVAAGAFGSEISLIADGSRRRNRAPLAAADTPQALGALYPATSLLAIGEELYAAGAQITEEKKYLRSLVVEDILRLVLVLGILGAAVLAFIGSQ